MTFGFPAYFGESRTFYGQPDQLSAAVKFAFDKLGWQYMLLSNDEFQANIPINASSWGEKLTVKILPGGVLRAESKCVYPMQCFDWGKNKENVGLFFTQVELTQQNQSRTSIPEKEPSGFDERGLTPLERVFTEEGKE